MNFTSSTFNSPLGKKTTKSITAFKNQIQFANNTILDVKNQRIIFQEDKTRTDIKEIEFLKESTQQLMNSPTFSIKGENLSTFCYGNSPGPSLKKKESENTRFFLSEQKENHIKLMNSTLNERKKNTNLIYYPNSFNSPNKLLLKDKDESQNSSSQKPQQPTKSNFRNMKNSDIKQNNKNSDIKQNNHKFLNSLKNFSDEFLTSTSNFINSNLNKMSDRKQCSCDIGLSKLESCKTALKWFKSNEVKTATMNDLKLLYENLQKEKGDEKSLDQIRRDITRTYSHNSFFNENSNGQPILERLLVTYSKYDTEIKYCQGMNYIAANLVFHAEETLAFWLLDHLFKKFQIRDIYIPNFPGLSKHLQLIDILIMIHLPDLYSHLCKNNVKSDMFCIPWLFSLFGVLIPIEELLKFYDNFIDMGWSYFYKVVIAYLAKNKQELLEADSSDILEILSRDNYKVFSEKDYKEQRLYWRVVLRNADNIIISQDIVKYLHSTYNSEKRVFKI